MLDSKLLLLLKSFTPQEIHRFRLYLQSPYHNSNPLFYKLFEAIRPYLHSRNKNTLAQETIWKQCFKTKKYNPLAFYKSCSNLYQLAADFISLNQLELNSQAISLNYLQVLNHRNLTDLFSFHAKKTNEAIQQNEASSNFFFEQFQLQMHINNNQELLQSRQQQPNTGDVLSALENFYLFQKLKYWSAAKHYKKLFDQPVPILWEDFLLNYIQSTKIENEDINRYKQILLLQIFPDEAKYYTALKKDFLSSKKNKNKAARKDVCNYLVNYCIAKINQGKTDFYAELYAIYQLAIAQELIIEKKAISPWDYKNIVTVALQVKEINWVENFIKTYSSQLPKDESENAFNYNLAKVYFIQKKYDKSLQLLQQVAYTDMFYQLGVKVTQAKTLYELQEWDTLDDFIFSFKKMLTRKRKLSEVHKRSYKKFVFYLQKLLQSKNKKQATVVLKQLNTDEQVPDKSWLVEKLEAM